jgi:site-specific DNA-methyltransferase (adenine-specific)
MSFFPKSKIDVGGPHEELKQAHQQKNIETAHLVIFGNCMSMEELADESCQFMVTSPPYFNAPHDYVGLFKDYQDFCNMMFHFATESHRVLAPGRIAAVNIDDMLVDGEKYPIVADTIKIFQEAGFRYRDKIIWKKPDGFIRASRRSGVLMKHPYPMYFYPDNLLESILIFQKGRFDYKSIPQRIRELSKIDRKEVLENKWYVSLWEIGNVLPGSKLEKGIAAFPEEIPYRLIKLFSNVGETVLDPFLGSGTTMKMARKLDRNCVGYELKPALEEIIRQKVVGDENAIMKFKTRKVH